MRRKKSGAQDRRAVLANKSIELPECVESRLFSSPEIFVHVAMRCQADDALIECDRAINGAVVETSILDERRSSERVMSDSLRFNYECVRNRMRAYLSYLSFLRASVGDERQNLGRSYAATMDRMVRDIESFLRESMPSAEELAPAKTQNGAILSDDDEIEDVCKRMGEMTTDSEAERSVALSSGVIGGSGQFFLSDDDDS